MYICEILSVGTELLLGDIVNTNAQFLSKELAALGIAVLRHSTVGDNPARLADALREALARSDLVITTGGLGPTEDDITRAVCCEVLGEALRRDEAIVEKMRDYFRQRGIEMPKNNEKQALVPQNGTVFANNNGTAPGLAIEKDGKCVIMVPGPPRELIPMFQNALKPFLKKFSGGLIVSHTVYTMGVGESKLAARVAEFLAGENPTVAPYAKSGEAQLRVTASGSTVEEAEALCAPLLTAIRERLGALVYGVDVGSIENAVVERLRQRGRKLAVAESCTGGYIAKRITDVPGASQVFDCGIVSYAESVKTALLGVSPESLRQYSAVSEQVAGEMAEGVRRLGNVDYGLAATGYAGPQSTAQNGKAAGETAGMSWVALAHAGGVTAEQVLTGRPEDRDFNRYVTASRALNLLRLHLDSVATR